MKIGPTFIVLFALLLATSCSSIESRIQSNTAAYNSWPADVQQKVKMGQVEVGFTEGMVLVAVGWPDRKNTRTTVEGTSEVWLYLDHGPHFSIGVGVGSASIGSDYSGAAVVGADGFASEVLMRVVFNGGRVSAIERRIK